MSGQSDILVWGVIVIEFKQIENLSISLSEAANFKVVRAKHRQCKFSGLFCSSVWQQWSSEEKYPEWDFQSGGSLPSVREGSKLSWYLSPTALTYLFQASIEFSPEQVMQKGLLCVKFIQSIWKQFLKFCTGLLIEYIKYTIPIPRTPTQHQKCLQSAQYNP